MSIASAATNPQVFACIKSWLKELDVSEVVASPLLEVSINGLSSDSSFDAAVETLCAIFYETKGEPDTYKDTIQVLYQRLMTITPKVVEAAANAEDEPELFKGLTRLFSEAGEAWVGTIAREPDKYRSLVENILKCVSLGRDREAIGITFNFWYDLKQVITPDNRMEARLQFVDVFSNLMDILLKHLEYPKPENGDESDLFEGDREEEEKFREFRHTIG